jgi:hypothetical protein
MPFQLSGVSMAIAPADQKWVDIITGYDHTGRPIFAASKNVELSFDQMSVSLYNQFSALNGTSLVSIQLLSIDQATSYVTYSNTGINLQIKDRPNLEAGNVTKFTVLITGITP